MNNSKDFEKKKESREDLETNFTILKRILVFYNIHQPFLLINNHTTQ